jgi:LmbE family N-acetylglucosaminyl deacetylase
VILFVFAHQDDELAAARSIRAHGDVACAFLTDGASRVSAERRNAESLAALAELGVPAERVAFLSVAHDGQLVENLDDALAALEARFAGAAITGVGLLAWEGGHHDHDAAHLAGLAFAKRRGIEAFEHPLYSAEGRLYRALRPVGAGWRSERIGRRDAWRILRLVRHYRSQKRTWAAMLPETTVRLLLLARTHVRTADPRRLFAAPHRGRLLYERRFRVPQARFRDAAAPFLERHFGDRSM